MHYQYILINSNMTQPKKEMKKLKTPKLTGVTQELLDRILALHDTDDMYDLAIFLLTVSGRKRGAIYKGDITVTKKKKTLKIKGGGCFPIMVSNKKFMKSLERFRRLIGETRFISSTLGRRTKTMFGDNFCPLDYCRIYVSYMFEHRNPDETESHGIFAMVILHQKSIPGYYAPLRILQKGEEPEEGEPEPEEEEKQPEPGAPQIGEMSISEYNATTESLDERFSCLVEEEKELEKVVGIPKHLVYIYHGLAKRLNDKNKDLVLAAIKRTVLANTKTFNSQCNAFSRAKKYFKRFTTDKEFLSQIKPHCEITQKSFAASRERMINRTMLEVSEYSVKGILKQHNSKDIHELAVFLLTATGRRIGELLEKDMEIVKGERSRVVIESVLKDKEDRKNLEFPIAVSNTKFRAAYRRFKRLYRDVTKSTFPNLLGRHIKERFGKAYHTHTFRKIYAAYMFKHKNPKRIIINTFIRNILLHQELTSSIFYTDVALT